MQQHKYLKNGDVGPVWLSQSHAVDLNKLELWQISSFTRLLQIATNFMNCGCLTSARDTRYVHAARKKKRVLHRAIVKRNELGDREGEEREREAEAIITTHPPVSS